MGNLLNEYIKTQQNIKNRITNNTFSNGDLLVMQEVNYRICVLETCRTFCMSAPVTNDTAQMSYHYNLVDAYIRFIQGERRFGPRADDNLRKKRDSAADALNRIVDDQRRRFSNYRPTAEGQYKTDVSNLIHTVLPAWVAYRNTYIEI